MNRTPEIENILDAIVDICGAALQSGEPLDRNRLHSLTESLSINGWKRHSTDSEPLSLVVEKRVKEKFPEPAIHRGGELRGLIRAVQAAYDRASRWDTSEPKGSPVEPRPPRTMT